MYVCLFVFVLEICGLRDVFDRLGAHGFELGFANTIWSLLRHDTNLRHNNHHTSNTHNRMNVSCSQSLSLSRVCVYVVCFVLFKLIRPSYETTWSANLYMFIQWYPIVYLTEIVCFCSQKKFLIFILKQTNKKDHQQMLALTFGHYSTFQIKIKINKKNKYALVVMKDKFICTQFNNNNN